MTLMTEILRRLEGSRQLIKIYHKDKKKTRKKSNNVLSISPWLMQNGGLSCCFCVDVFNSSGDNSLSVSLVRTCRQQFLLITNNLYEYHFETNTEHAF